jgi:pleuromutilin/lincosamide/streptogramin A transport system ATP-binding/permease protein
LFVSHERRFIKTIANRLIAFGENKKITVFKGSYDAYKNDFSKPQEDMIEQQLIVVETKLTEVLSKLSIEPSDKLEEEFQELLKQKRNLEMQRE